MSDATVHAELDALNVQLQALERHVAQRVSTLCPGPHNLQFHSAYPNWWCNVCGRSQRGLVPK